MRLQGPSRTCNSSRFCCRRVLIGQSCQEFRQPYSWGRKKTPRVCRTILATRIIWCAQYTAESRSHRCRPCCYECWSLSCVSSDSSAESEANMAHDATLFTSLKTSLLSGLTFSHCASSLPQWMTAMPGLRSSRSLLSMLPKMSLPL